jgi:hypothetical protein
MEESRRIGRPLGVVCAVASAAIAASDLYGTHPNPFGPLSALGAILVVSCTTATLATAALEARNARAETTETLRRLGTPQAVLRNATTLRAAVLLMVSAPLTWAVGSLAALPLAA